MELKFKTISQFEVKEEEGRTVVEGWGAVYNNIDSYKDVLLPGCAKKTLSERGHRIKLCNQHDIHNPIGKFLELKELEKDGKEGIWFKAEISAAEKGIATKIKEGILEEFSIGYREIAAEKGEKDGMEVNLVKEIKLFEISVVTVAANDQATVVSVKSEQEQIEAAFNELISKEKNEEKQFKLMQLKRQTLEAIRPEENPPAEPEPFTAKDARQILLSKN